MPARTYGTDYDMIIPVFLLLRVCDEEIWEGGGAARRVWERKGLDRHLGLVWTPGLQGWAQKNDLDLDPTRSRVPKMFMLGNLSGGDLGGLGLFCVSRFSCV